jgi:hypothetical protein
VIAIPIIVNGETWWSDPERTTVAPSPGELHIKLAEKFCGNAREPKRRKRTVAAGNWDELESPP